MKLSSLFHHAPAALLLLLAACAKTMLPVPAPAQAPSVPPALRFTQANAVPTAYEATLKLDPSQPTFSGEIAINLSLKSPTRQFYLNGRGLEILSATLQYGKSAVSLTVTSEAQDWLLFVSQTPMPSGDCTLRVRYRGKVDDSSSFGIFRQPVQSDWYLFTQFEARGARRAFPSFDQPDLKVPWKLSLEVPEGLVALANTPEIGREAIGEGMVRISFAKSKPLPSYLVAFAVGPFALVDVGKTRSGVPVRIAAPRGRGEETAWARESTLALIKILEDYTKISYPYAKLDLVSIPATGSFGAMENAGLITYTETLLLSKDNDLAFRQRYASVGAHELSHQWFGNLVTNAWWDDIWLNESFATWSAAKVLKKFRPSWGSDLDWIERRDAAMQADRLASARVIHQPIEVEEDIGSAFDGITYAKGASVLTMFEGFLGEAVFQRGIEHYLGNNQWKSLAAADFLTSMDVGTGKKISHAFTTFLDKPGTPLVSFVLECRAGQTPRLQLRQERYIPVGSSIHDSPNYSIPVCVRYPGLLNAEPHRLCVLLAKESAEIDLLGASECPAWVVPNAGATGYYRSQMEVSLLDSLVTKAPLSEAEEAGLASDLRALVLADRAPLGTLLTLLSTMARSNNDAMVLAAARSASLAHWLGDAELPKYQKWIRENFSQRAEKLGWSTSAGDSPLTIELRNTLLGLLLFDAEDSTFRARGQALASTWIADPTSVDPNIAGLALRVGARYGDVENLERYVATLKAMSNRSRRRLLFVALGSVQDPLLAARSLALLLDVSIDVRESHRMLAALASQRKMGPLVLRFVRDSFPSLSTRYGEEMGTRLGRVASVQCEETNRDEVEKFLSQKIAPMEGGKRSAAQALEQFHLCVAAREVLRFPSEP